MYNELQVRWCTGPEPAQKIAKKHMLRCRLMQDLAHNVWLKINRHSLAQRLGLAHHITCDPLHCSSEQWRFTAGIVRCGVFRNRKRGFRDLERFQGLWTNIINGNFESFPLTTHYSLFWTQNMYICRNLWGAVSKKNPNVHGPTQASTIDNSNSAKIRILHLRDRDLGMRKLNNEEMKEDALIPLDDENVLVDAKEFGSVFTSSDLNKPSRKRVKCRVSQAGCRIWRYLSVIFLVSVDQIKIYRSREKIKQLPFCGFLEMGHEICTQHVSNHVPRSRDVSPYNS